MTHFHRLQSMILFVSTSQRPRSSCCCHAGHSDCESPFWHRHPMFELQVYLPVAELTRNRCFSACFQARNRELLLQRVVLELIS
jgi:hypothetical protein